MTAVLDILDREITCWVGDDAVVSPGFAHFAQNQYHFGAQAQQMARIAPREVNTRYWTRLSTDTLVPAIGPARHTADLAHSHLQSLLQQLGQPNNALMSVSGHMAPAQLSLLMGILQSLGVTTSAVVHRSLLLAAGHDVQWHCEIQLHQALVTPLSREGGKLAAGDPIELAHLGSLSLLDRLGQRVADAFISQTRFDPHKRATTEQALFDALPNVLMALRQHSETQVTIEGYSARITRDSLIDIGTQAAAELSAIVGPDGPVMIDTILADLPGFAIPCATLVTPTEQIPTIFLREAQVLTGNPSELVFHRSISDTIDETAHDKADADLATASLTEPTDDTAQPTHLLEGNTAIALGRITTLDNGTVLLAAADGLRLGQGYPPALTVNGEAAMAGQALHIGDELADSDGVIARLIIVRG